MVIEFIVSSVAFFEVLEFAIYPINPCTRYHHKSSSMIDIHSSYRVSSLCITASAWRR